MFSRITNFLLQSDEDHLGRVIAKTLLQLALVNFTAYIWSYNKPESTGYAVLSTILLISAVLIYEVSESVVGRDYGPEAMGFSIEPCECES